MMGKSMVVWAGAALLFLVSAVAANNQECSECVVMMEAFSKKYVSDLSFGTFKKGVDWLCHGMLGDQVEHCTALSNKYADPLFQMLKNRTGPESVCRFAGFCGPMDEPKKYFHFDCSDCKTTAKAYFKKASQTLEQKINENICVFLDEFNIPHCQDIAKQFTPLMDFLTANLDMSYLFCTSVEICPPKLSLPKMNLHNSMRKRSDNVSPQCKACRYFFETFSPMERLESMLDSSVCDRLPMMNEACADFFSKYGVQLKEKLRYYLSEKQVCENAFNLCGDQPSPSPYPRYMALLEQPTVGPFTRRDDKDDGKSCKACQKTVETMKKLLDFTGTALKNSTLVCQMFPVVGVNCQDFASKFDKVKNSIDFSQICTQELGLCKGNNPSPRPPWAPHQFQFFKDSDKKLLTAYSPQFFSQEDLEDSKSSVMAKFFYRVVERN